MGKIEKLILKIIIGKSDYNIDFSDLCGLLVTLGFDMRIKGSHHIFRKEGINAKVNLQQDGKLAKSYQVRQVRKMLIDNKLIEDFDV